MKSFRKAACFLAVVSVIAALAGFGSIGAGSEARTPGATVPPQWSEFLPAHICGMGDGSGWIGDFNSSYVYIVFYSTLSPTSTTAQTFRVNWGDGSPSLFQYDALPWTNAPACYVLYNGQWLAANWWTGYLRHTYSAGLNYTIAVTAIPCPDPSSSETATAVLSPQLAPSVGPTGGGGGGAHLQV